MEYEQESKRLRIIQREKRKEMEIIMRRCHDIGFKYICVPMEQKALCFGVTNERIVQPSNTGLNSFMRRALNENFLKESPSEIKKVQRKVAFGEESTLIDTEPLKIRPSPQFASKVPRFMDAPITSSGNFRRRPKKPEKLPPAKSDIAFGSKMTRKTTLIKISSSGAVWRPNVNPGVGVYNISKLKIEPLLHSFNGPVKFADLVTFICGAANKIKCNGACGETPKNVYWMHTKTKRILCRSCMNDEKLVAKKKAKNHFQAQRNLKVFDDYKRFRYCDFVHHHQDTKAAVRLLTPSELTRRLRREKYLSLKKY